MLLRIMFYAVKRGRVPGIYKTWDECQKQVKGFPNCAFKKFATEREALCFIADESSNNGVIISKANSFSSILEPGPNLLLPNNVSVRSKNAKSLSELMSKSSSSKGSFYAVHRGFKPGIYETWTECEKQIQNFKNPSYRKFNFKEEAEEFMKTGGIKKVPTSEAKRLKVDIEYEASEYSTPEDISLNPEVTYNVFTDGASSKNGTVCAAAGIGVYWGPNHPLNVSQRLAGRQTNNRAEIYAATYALKQAKQFGARKIKLYSDSQFMIKGITQWINKWKTNGWVLSNRQPVKNKEDFIELDKARDGLDVEFIYIKAHAQLPGNTEADRLAVEGAQKDLEDAFVILT